MAGPLGERKRLFVDEGEKTPDRQKQPVWKEEEKGEIVERMELKRANNKKEKKESEEVKRKKESGEQEEEEEEEDMQEATEKEGEGRGDEERVALFMK